MKEDLEAILETYRFEIQDEITRRSIINDLSNYMESNRRNGVIHDFIVIDEGNDRLEFKFGITYQTSHITNFNLISLQRMVSKQLVKYNISKHKL